MAKAMGRLGEFKINGDSERVDDQGKGVLTPVFEIAPQAVMIRRGSKK